MGGGWRVIREKNTGVWFFPDHPPPATRHEDLLGFPFGRHLQQKGVVRFAAAEVSLTGEGRIPYQLDGDPAGFLPVTARASEDHVWVWLPA